ncbi:type I-B CRISPR-associated protein Cas5b [Fervidobacterium nodosum]|uniref:CRISPR-associated protein Cas5, Hmari subtype n=1 Tax=Fervidobacterium nodosum (strain ATCC 35602 / DSM 5306 / Rt17-B1) TaxID=381764 RepID=A7HLK6_FERNB|nr:type I-B CRISPR-associated protein Cas5b [Fervidobacterium nodosum]ABS60789.1 CRISPR-associated protein Cas5, Hmari subtype [Fervidobacterium nodosum Rt17-B1]PHJ13301.1 CRISPR-associated protein Cas5 [Fervidobacterium sp. SC_NGM5_G05]
MEFLVFDIKGKFAHFRKFYTNSSSLSYSIPPRTTLEGIIAAILGFERDSYYEILNAQKLNIGLKKATPTRKIIQTLNYIKAKTPSNVYDPDEHTQIPFEIITSNDKVIYRVYVNHVDQTIMEDLEYRLKNNKFCYIPYFGVAPFNISIDLKGKFQAEPKFSEDFVKVSSVIRRNLISSLKVEEEVILLKEKMPRDFSRERTVIEMEDYIFEESGKAIEVKLNSHYYVINEENIVLM